MASQNVKKFSFYGQNLSLDIMRHFFSWPSISSLLDGFRPFSTGLGKTNFATPKVYFPANQMFEFLVHARMPKCGPFFAILFRYFSLPLLFLFSFLFIASFFAHFIFCISHGIVTA